MTKHFEKLREYAQAVSAEYGIGERFAKAVQEDLTELGRLLGQNLADKSAALISQGITRAATLGVARLSDVLSARSKRK
jgi:hypothetical protein